MRLSRNRLNRLPFLAGICLTLLLPSSAFAWFPFIASNGQPTKWVWNTSCNPESRPIAVIYDAAMDPATSAWMLNVPTDVHFSWNAGLSLPLFQSPIFAPSNSTVSSVSTYLRSPPANTIRVVWDADGSILSSLGVPMGSVLGIGLGFSTYSIRPQDICSGMVLLNGPLIESYGGSKDRYLYFTLQHELGHVLGLAHTIAGDNTSNWSTVGVFSSPSSVPTMYPFLTNLPMVGQVLHADDTAAKEVLYGP